MVITQTITTLHWASLTATRTFAFSKNIQSPIGLFGLHGLHAWLLLRRSRPGICHAAGPRVQRWTRGTVAVEAGGAAAEVGAVGAAGAGGAGASAGAAAGVVVAAAAGCFAGSVVADALDSAGGVGSGVAGAGAYASVKCHRTTTSSQLEVCVLRESFGS